MKCPKCGSELRAGVMTFRLKGWLYWRAWPLGNFLYETTGFFRANGSDEETETFYTGLPVAAEFCEQCRTTVI